MSLNIADMGRNARTFLFGGDDTPTIRVVEQFFHARFKQEKVVVKTPAPWNTPDEMTPANEVIKGLDWDEVQWDFDERREAWTLNADSVDLLREAADEAGYDFTDERDGDGDDSRLARVAAYAQDGDTVRVRYKKKNGNGVNTYEGEVQTARPDDATIRFRDANDKPKFVRHGDDGDVGLFSRGRYPFMGEVVAVTVMPEDGPHGGDPEVRAEIEETVEAAVDIYNADIVSGDFGYVLEKVGGPDAEAVRQAVAAGRLSVDATLPTGA